MSGPWGLSPWIVSDDLWERIEPLLPKRERRFRYPGRKPVPDRQVQSGIPFVLHPGVQWEHLPEELDFGSASDTRQTRAPSTAASKSARRWVAGTSARIHMAMVHGGPLSPAWWLASALPCRIASPMHHSALYQCGQQLSLGQPSLGEVAMGSLCERCVSERGETGRIGWHLGRGSSASVRRP
ncbi:transposase [Streptomyces sp. NPDC127061]|uniref:transposase n=1 Tax=Streptomyces sp. NPDC127061 TaxID=3347122 RepID=UPI00365C24B6